MEIFRFVSVEQRPNKQEDCRSAYQYDLSHKHYWLLNIFLPAQKFSFTHLHLVDHVQEELVGILLSVGGKLGVSPADQGLQHPGRDALLLVLK